MTIQKLVEFIKQRTPEGLCLAFSGGVDSALLLKAAAMAQVRTHAVTFDTYLHPRGDVKIAREYAESLGILHQVIKINELDNANIMDNPTNRCYRCKKLLFTKLQAYAVENGLAVIMDGTNADDLKEYRPGLRALSELGIISPLMALGVTKGEVRQMAAKNHIPVSARPSAPCLATRLPYGARLDPDTLNRIMDGEEFIKSLGYKVVRLRLHGDVTRIEIDKKMLPSFLNDMDRIISGLKELGFVYITLDMEFFRSGSMDVMLTRKE